MKGEGMERNSAKRLTFKVDDGKLFVEIGVDTLAFAAQRYFDEMHFQETGELDGKGIQIADNEAFAQAVLYKLDDEHPDDGSSPMTRLLDKMFEAVADDGDLSLSHPDWD